MAIINPWEIPTADQPRKKLGSSAEYGCHCYGGFYYGLVNDLYGIYRVTKGALHQIIIKSRFSIPHNPKTPAQDAQRLKYAESVTEWQNLTDEQKLVYNNRARGKKLSGYNLFQKEYLLSH
jgi:hypothetical protein